MDTVPPCGRPTSLAPGVGLEDRGDHAERRGHREQVHHRRLERHDRRPQQDGQQQHRERHHEPDDDPQPFVQPHRDVRRTWAARRWCTRRRERSSRTRRTRSVVPSSGGAGGRLDHDHRGVAGGVRDRRRDRRHARHARGRCRPRRPRPAPGRGRRRAAGCRWRPARTRPRPGRTPAGWCSTSGWLPASCGQVRMPSAGAASTPSATSGQHDRRAPAGAVTRRAQRSVRVGPGLHAAVRDGRDGAGSAGRPARTAPAPA